jgi:hypothetical protein
MPRPKRQFADMLDLWLEEAPEIEVRDAVTHIAVWARVRRFSFDARIIDRRSPGRVLRPGELLSMESPGELSNMEFGDDQN